MLRCISRIALLSLLGTVLSACGTTGPVAPLPPVPPPVAVFGTYELQTIKGSPLPWTLSSGETSKTEITGGSLTLAPDLTFRRTTHQRYTRPEGVIEAIHIHAGTYTKTDSGAVVLRFDGSTFDMLGQVTGKTLTISFAGCCEPWVMVRP